MVSRARISIISMIFALVLLCGALFIVATGPVVAKGEVIVTIDSNPTHMVAVLVDGSLYSTPQTFYFLPGSPHGIEAVLTIPGESGERYEFSAWSDGGGLAHEIIIPASDTTYTANYDHQYQVSFDTSPSGVGSVSPAGDWKNAGPLSIQATPSAGYAFSSWSSNNAAITFGSMTASTTATIGGPGTITAVFAVPVSVTVTSNPTGSGFVLVDGDAITTPQTYSWVPGTSHTLGAYSEVAGDAGERYRFDAWSDGGEMINIFTVPNIAMIVTAGYLHQYQVSFVVSPEGAGTTDPSGTNIWVEEGSLALQATPSAGYSFSSWGSSNVAITFNLQAASTTANIGGPGTITLNFAPNPYEITITSIPAGQGYVLVDDLPYNTPYTFTWLMGHSHRIEAIANVTVTDGERYSFTSWSDGGSPSHMYTVTNSAAIVTANYSHQYRLTVINPIGTTIPAAGVHWYAEGTSVQITATPPSSSPDERNNLTWIGTGTGAYSGPDNPASVTMNGPIIEEADYALQYSLTVIDPIGTTIPAAGVHWYAAGESVQITAAPPSSTPAGERYLFDTWIGVGTGAYSGPSSPAVVTMSGPMTETASYTHQYQVSFAVSPSGAGTITPWGDDVWQDAGQISIHAVALARYEFSSWNGTGSISFDSQTASTSATIGGTGTITAIFDLLPVSVTIASSQIGSEYILVDDGIITTPHTFSWLPGTSHSLKAASTVPIVPGERYLFSSWSDGLPQNHTYTVQMSPATITATFIPQFQLTMSSNFGSTTPAVGAHWFNAGALVPVSATAPMPTMGERYVDFEWAGSGAGSYSGSANSVSVTMNGAITENASWTHQYQVSFAVTPVTPSIGGAITPMGANTWMSAGPLPIVATPSPDFIYSSWTSSTVSIAFTAMSPSTTAIINGPGTITANFIMALGITITSNPTGNGYVLVDGVPITTPHVYEWASGIHTIEAVPSFTVGTDQQFIFNSWSDGGLPTHTFTVTDPTASVSANFDHKVRLTMAANVGTTTPSMSANKAWHDEGSTVTISATAPMPGLTNERYVWNGWTGTGIGSYTGMTNTITITLGGPVTETASWTLMRLPGTPTGLSATPGDARVTLSWTAPLSDGGAVIDQYVVYQDGLEVKRVSTLTTTVSGLTNGQEYSFTVAANNRAGNGPNSTAVSVTPERPLNTLYLEITSPSTGSYSRTGSVLLKWTVSDSYSEITKIEISTNGTTWSTVSGTSYALNSLSNGVHTVYVRATNSVEYVNTTSVTFMVDKTSPLVTFLSPIPGGYLKSHSVAVDWIISENGSGLAGTEFSIDGTNWTRLIGSDSTLSMMDGLHTIYIRATDNAGNVGITTASFIIDTIPPTILSKTPTGTAELTRATMDITFSEAMNRLGTTISVTGVNGSYIWNGNNLVFTPAAALRPLTVYNVTLSGTDQAGNGLSSSWSFRTANLGKISGVVMGYDGKVMVNAIVKLIGQSTGAQTEMGHLTLSVDDAALAQTTTTDRSGSYVFYDVAPGSYMIEVTQPGYGSKSTPVTMTAAAVVGGGLTVDQVLPESLGDSGLFILAIVGLAAALIGLVFMIRRKSGPPAVIGSVAKGSEESGNIGWNDTRGKKER